MRQGLKAVTLEAGRLAFRALVLAPLIGAALGCVAAYVSFNVSAWASGSEHRYDPWFTSSFYGIPFGALFGLVFGILVAFPLRRERLGRAAAYLGGGTATGAAVGLLGGEAAPPLSCLCGMVGFWIGFFWLMAVRSEEARAKADALESVSEETRD